MKIYLTGFDSIKNPRKNYNQEETKKRVSNFQDETDEIKEESITKELNEDDYNASKRKKYKKDKKVLIN